jgi:transketolase
VASRWTRGALDAFATIAETTRPGSSGRRWNALPPRTWQEPMSPTNLTHAGGLTAEFLLRAKLRLLQMHYESRVGHIGGNLSCLEILMTLYHEALGPEDEFVLSKGHAAGALYITLWSVGAISEDRLNTFHQDGTLLSGHPPPRGIPQIQFATGSLGHGLSLASGLALAKQLKGAPGRIFCLMSDGEWNEGSNWEALIFLAQHRLDLTLIVDLNGLQGFGRTREVANVADLSEKFRSFGVRAVEVDGHDPAGLADAMSERATGPAAIVARTRKGHGVSFMEDRLEWHYLPMSEEQYREAVRELSEQCAKHSAARS